MSALTHYEQSGNLTRVRADGETVTEFGWFSLANNRRDVIARKFRGRNRWLLCGVESVIDFTLVPRYSKLSRAPRGVGEDF